MIKKYHRNKQGKLAVICGFRSHKTNPTLLRSYIEIIHQPVIIVNAVTSMGHNFNKKVLFGWLRHSNNTHIRSPN